MPRAPQGLSPDARIIERFGGYRELAKKLGAWRGREMPWRTVYDWLRSGIPRKYQHELLAMGSRLDPPLKPEDYFDLPAVRRAVRSKAKRSELASAHLISPEQWRDLYGARQEDPEPPRERQRQRRSVAA